MSLNITNGVYKIFNVAYPNQVADLLYPGGVNGTIGGFRNNEGSKRNQVYPYSCPYSFVSDVIAHEFRFARPLVASNQCGIWHELRTGFHLRQPRNYDICSYSPDRRC